MIVVQALALIAIPPHISRVAFYAVRIANLGTLM